MRIPEILIVSVFALGLLSGCGKPMLSCKQSNKDYAGSPELPPLKAPAGLEGPGTRNALKIPALATPERIRGRDEACLDSPPPFATPKGTDAKKPK